jgi:2-aminoadipate transaminase
MLATKRGVPNNRSEGITLVKNLTAFYSQSALNMRRSEIRDLLKVTRRPGMISFAGGLPDPQTFPVEDLEDISCKLLREKGAIALQYGPTDGEPPLREEIAKWMNREKVSTKPENILITAGSQQGLDIVSRVFLDPNDIVIMELPTYIGGLQAFNAYRVKMIGIPQDNEGMRIDLLEEELVKLARRNKKPKFIYVVPDFQNPSGVTLSLNRREKLLRLAYEYDIPILEDSPYRDLRYEGENIPAIYSLDTQNQVIVLGTFSKLLCPGLRIAWIMAPAGWMDRMVMAKQGMDLCSPTYTQLLVAEYLKRGLLPKQIEKIRKLYGRKLKVMLKALKQHMPEGVKWSKPRGGLFLWIELPNEMSANDLFPHAIENNVAYVVGSAYSSEQQIVEGIQRLSSMLKENVNALNTRVP